MIVNIGIDSVDHDLNSKMVEWDASERFPKRIFSNTELEYYASNKDLRFLAGRFAAKEAVLKCLGTGMIDGLSLKEIDIRKTPNGQPQVHLSGKAKVMADQLAITEWHISISHSSNSSTAFVIAEKKQ